MHLGYRIRRSARTTINRRMKAIAMKLKSLACYRAIKASLRARFALGLALPIFLMMALLSLVHSQRERQLFEAQLRLSSSQLGDMLMGSLRHAMLTDDRAMIGEILDSVAQMDTIQRIQIIDLNGEVRVDSAGRDVGKRHREGDLGCKECHRFPPEDRPRTAKLIVASNVLRISTPIANGPECVRCHSEKNGHLGVLLVDASLVDFERHLWNDLKIEAVITLMMTVVIILVVYALVHRLVIRRMVALSRPLARLAAGDFSTRLPVSSGPPDELDRLAGTLNRMAEELERHVREQEEHHQLREQAIIEERERIARELHDGIAQLLGYVNTKAMAVRLMLKNQKLEAADQQLFQLEEAARRLFVDVREAILGLRIAGRNKGASLAATLEEFTIQFSRLSGLPVQLTLAPAVEDLSLKAEVELHLIRIVQEALANVRKHAMATNAQVRLEVHDGMLELEVSDNGVGFDPNHIQADHRPHFGLCTMRERAEAIGAEFQLDSRPGVGTRIVVRLPLEKSSQRSMVKEDGHNARAGSR